MKKYTFIVVIIFYAIFTLLEFKFQPVPAYCDGYWYIKVAQNIANGKGMVEDIVLYHFPRIEKMKKFPHPIGNYWNPLNSIILAGFYKIFGITNYTSRLAAFIIDLIVVLTIFFIAKKLFSDDLFIAIFSSLIYIVHYYSLTLRAFSGLPETYTTLFLVPALYFLYLSLTKRWDYVILSSLFGGLSYLSRNESGIYVILLLVLFILRKKYKENFRWFLTGILIFLITVSWWEIRNFVIFGKYTGEMKKNLLLCNEFFDYMCFNKQWTIKEWLSDGIMNVVIRKFASLHYKIDSFISIVHWIVGTFLFYPL
ncbi:MAG: glycosyltransferase family 39 protein [Endomicrobiia bacterium]